MKIHISKHYSRNKGNVSLLYTLVEKIFEYIPNSDIMIASSDPEDTKDLFGYRTCEEPFQTRLFLDSKGWDRAPLAIKESYYIFTQILLAILARYSMVKPSRLKGRYLSLREIIETDLLVSPGGHLFTNFNNMPGVFAHFLPSFLASIAGVKYIVIAQTIGPFFGKWKTPCRLLTKYVVEHADYVSVRDDNSLKTISECNFSIKKLAKTNDLVFLYPLPPIEKNKTKNKPVVGFTFHHIYYKHYMTKEEYISRMTKFIVQIINKYDVNIKFISMEESMGNKGEELLLKELISLLGNPDNIEIVKASRHPNNIVKEFTNLDLLVATKLHSVIYGLRCCIPVLTIAYDKKSEDFMNDFGQGDYSVPLANFDADVAFNQFVKLERKSETIKHELNNYLEKIQQQSMENIVAIKACLGSHSKTRIKR